MRGAVVAGMLLALGLSGAARGQDTYQSDVLFDFLNVEDDGTQVETSMKSLGYRWYFQEVDGMEGPYELQPFRQRASWAEAAFIWFRDDDTPEMEGSGFHISSRVVIPETPVGIDVEYLTLDADMGGGAGSQDFMNQLSIGAVVWLCEENRTAVEVAFERADFKSGIPADSDTFRIGARTIIPMQDMHLEVAAHYASTSYDADATGDMDEKGIEVETRFFFNQEVFAGFNFSTVDNDIDDTSNWQVSGGYSHASGFHAGLLIGEDGDDPTFGVDVGYRF